MQKGDKQKLLSKKKLIKLQQIIFFIFLFWQVKDIQNINMVFTDSYTSECSVFVRRHHDTMVWGSSLTSFLFIFLFLFSFSNFCFSFAFFCTCIITLFLLIVSHFPLCKKISCMNMLWVHRVVYSKLCGEMNWLILEWKKKIQGSSAQYSNFETASSCPPVL
jgi:hypothetical protein